MTNDSAHGGPDQPDVLPPEDERIRTGVPAVDEVITAVEQLEDRPIEEHVGVFETAHEQLRRALDDPAGAAGPADPAGAAGPA
jgi:hypothetical protein